MESRIHEVERLLAALRDRVDPMVARRFACSCVRAVWDKVLDQKFVRPEAIEQCCRAVELTEASLVHQPQESDLRSVDYSSICDSGNSAFMAAAHVGWNLFAPHHGLHEIDEFENAMQIAQLVAAAGDQSEVSRQVQMLRAIHAEIGIGPN